MHERKYKIMDGRLVKKDGESPVPEDEPLFILRASDRKALAAIVAYNMIADSLEHKAKVCESIGDFRAFQEKYPERMGEPDP
jgi:hypothetical protein